MKENGRSDLFAVGVWSVTGLLLAASVVDEVMPDAYE